MEISSLLACQNADGGWGYYRGGSSTEPTTFALLALSVSGCGQTVAARRGVQWLAASQRSDGGWPPRPGVDQSTWVTAIPMILPKAMRAQLRTDRAKGWVLAQQGREFSWSQRLRNYLLGIEDPLKTSRQGWPFYPDTAAWVSPTAFSILGLERFPSDDRAQSRCRSGRAFLLSHMCSDGGWNHGSFRALGHDLVSYPETTGLALLALHGENNRELKRSLSEAEEQLLRIQSLEAACWLRLGLLAHGKPVPLNLGNFRPPRSVTELALTVLTYSAANGNNIFIDNHEYA